MLAVVIGYAATKAGEAYIWPEIQRLSQLIPDGLWDQLFSTPEQIAHLVNSQTTRALTWTPPPRDPLILDLDGNGIRTSAIDASRGIVLFDHDSDGVKTASGWVAAGEGILVRDLNRNGSIDNGRELFGDNTRLTRGARAGQLAANGFEALADLDLNGDALFDANDAAYAELQLWKDLNQDGLSQSDELFSLDSLGVRSIALNATTATSDLGGGNSQTMSTSFTHQGADGVSTQKQVGNLLLSNNNFYREFTDDPEVLAAVQALPTMRGSGRVRDLRQAMSLGSPGAETLRLCVEQFAQGHSHGAQRAALDALLHAWGATSDMPSGANTDTRFAAAPGSQAVTASQALTRFAYDQPDLYAQITTLERFNGSTLLDKFLVRTAQGMEMRLGDEQQALLRQAFDALRDSVYSALVPQTRLRPYLSRLELHISDAGMQLDASPLLAMLQAAHSRNALNATVDLIDLDHHAQAQLLHAGLDTRALLIQWLLAQPFSAELEPELQKAGIYYGPVRQGSAKDDLYVGDDRDNTFTAGAGNDKVFGGAGNDALHGETGDDELDGGDGDDALTDTQGNNILKGGAGNDRISGRKWNSFWTLLSHTEFL